VQNGFSVPSKPSEYKLACSALLLGPKYLLETQVDNFGHYYYLQNLKSSFKMLPRLFSSALLATVSLCGIVSAAAVPEMNEALQKRALCGTVVPGHLDTIPSLNPFLICEEAPDVLSFIFQEDGNFVA
jgi:hypothetical protein